MFQDVHFYRALTIAPLRGRLLRQGNPAAKQLPDSLFTNPMTLIPLSQVSAWYQAVEAQTDDPDFSWRLLKDAVPWNQYGALSRWFLFEPDMTSRFRRINFGNASIQSCGQLFGIFSGPLVRWCYHQPKLSGRGLLHDSLRMVCFLMQVLREQLGSDYTPLKIRIPGQLSDPAGFSEWAGCAVEWHSPQLEIWVNSRQLNELDLSQVNKAQQTGAFQLSLAELDSMLSMPAADDPMKVLYEVVSYCCHFGKVRRGQVAQLLGVSEQQLQRRLHERQINFSQVSAYAVCFAAMELIRQGFSVAQTAERLGYSHAASLQRVFRKTRGQSLSHYAKQFQD
ncbi:hypothetical protein GCM10007895_22620 [Paraferrimonas sedimenticola]|uniref:HTH araC/xylS-type domain-containing protein n=2 Tax=Paraferrimonas sedimenticola TaxID=375674 RepID=A0AA37VYC4_9GAMM|nr:hypothetical protein GCM10007895_22620 [Paraferrimonas sedimenticola]